MPFGTKQVAENLVRAWSNELNKPDRGDVIFKVQDRVIYANSSILAMRSDYFETMFEGEWIECNNRNSNSNSNSNSNNYNNNSGSNDLTENEVDEDRYKYEIEITDFNYETVLEML